MSCYSIELPVHHCKRNKQNANRFVKIEHVNVKERDEIILTILAHILCLFIVCLFSLYNNYRYQ